MTLGFRSRPVSRSSRRFGSRLSRRPSRQGEWTRSNYAPQELAPATLAFFPLVNEDALRPLTRPTIVRCHLTISLLAGDLTLGNLVLGAFGLTLVRASTENALAGTLPDPGDSIQGRSSRWLTWRGFSLIGTDPVIAGLGHLRYEIDVRSMRRVLDEDANFGCVISSSVGSTANLCFQVSSSTFVKE